MSGISDKAIKNQYAENKFRGNGGDELQNKEFSDGSGLEMYDAFFRGYDPQIGRFWQIDPLADINEAWSPYSFVNDNPISFNDPLGLVDPKDTGTAKVDLDPVTVTPHTDPHVAKTIPGGSPEVKVEPPPDEVPDIPINQPTAEPTTRTEPSVEPIGGPGILGTAGLTIGLTIMPLQAGGKGFPNGDEGAVINHKIGVLPGEYVAPTSPFVGQGNRKDNTDPHIVYAFGFAAKDGRTPILKYGISDEFRWSMDRPEAQIAALRRKYGPTVMYSIYARTINRFQALMVERQLVTDHVALWKEMPREQDLPKSF